MSEKLKAAVIGLGILGSKHAQALYDNPNVQLVAVADIRQEVAEEVGARFGAKAYTDFRQMLRDQSLDVVTVATPDPLHREPTVAALEAGVPNIIHEKPLATTMEDALAIYEAVERHNAKLFMNFANRAAPLDVASRYVIQQGLLGRAVYGESRVDDNITVPTQMWGNRTKEWAAGSSTAHFLLSHVVDLLRWYFQPAEIKEVYAISQREVLGYTPDLYDAFLFFDTGLKVRVKAEWTKHIDELVEFYTCITGSEGTLIYNKLPGFGVQAGWRANLSKKITPTQLLQHQDTLLSLGTNVASLVHRPDPSTGELAAGGGEVTPSLEFRGPCAGTPTVLVPYFIDAILEDTFAPKSASHLGTLPNQVDGLKQTQVVTAIVASAESGKVVEVE